MKLTKETLKQIIKEELDAVLAEDTLEEEAVEEAMSQHDEKFQAAYERAKKEMPNATQKELMGRAIDLMRGAQ